MAYFTLDYALNLIRKSNLVIEIAQEWTGKLIFKDVATLVYYLVAIPWTVPDFSVEKYRTHLEKLQQQLEAEGELIFTQRRMLIKATRRKPFEHSSKSLSGLLLQNYLKPQIGGRVEGCWLCCSFSSIGLQLLNPQVIRQFIDRVQQGVTQSALLQMALWFLLIVLAQRGMAIATTYVSQQIA